MSSRRIPPNSPYVLLSRFEHLRSLLRDDRFSEQRARSLAHWALPRDRGLPHALLERTVAELISTEYQKISGTAGIGPKKMHMLLELLERAAATNVDVSEPEFSTNGHRQSAEFDESNVSDAEWQQWQGTIDRFQFWDLPLGRLSRCLQSLPTVLWHVPFREFQGKSLDELKRLRTFGEKRVRVVLKIFFETHVALSQCASPDHLVVQLRPRFVGDIEGWLHSVLHLDEFPPLHELRSGLVLPILNQVLHDGGETVHQVVVGRLGIEGPPLSVRRQARLFEVTRARIYQILESSQQIVQVRWPEGRGQLLALATCVGSDEEAAGGQLLERTRSLFYPERPPEDSALSIRNPAPDRSVYDRSQAESL